MFELFRIPCAALLTVFGEDEAVSTRDPPREKQRQILEEEGGKN